MEPAPESTATVYDPDDPAIQFSINAVRAKLKEEHECADVHIGSNHRVFRFLVARNFVIEKAAELLAADIEWRLEFHPEQLTPEDCPNEVATGKAYWHGFDGFGHPILLFFPAKHLPKESDPEEVKTFYIWLIEEGIRRMPPGVTQFTVMYDRKGYSMSNFDLGAAQHLAKIMQEHYPERLYTACICDVNWLFYVLYKMVSVFIDSRTKEKVCVYTGDYRPALLQFIDPSQLLTRHGGTSPYEYTDPRDITNLPRWTPTGNAGGSDVPVYTSAGEGGDAASVSDPDDDPDTALDEVPLTTEQPTDPPEPVPDAAAGPSSDDTSSPKARVEEDP